MCRDDALCAISPFMPLLAYKKKNSFYALIASKEVWMQRFATL